LNFSGSLAGEVTGTQGATVVSNAVSANTPSAVVRRDGAGSFSAGTVTLAGQLALPDTTASVGGVMVGGNLFLHNFGVQNTFLGASAGNRSMTGQYNTAVGNPALSANTTGGANSAFGANALSANTTGGTNSAFGAGVLFANTTGNANSAFGNGVLFLNTTGVANSAFGASALSDNTTGGDNSAFGQGGLYHNTTGGSNSAFGSAALFTLTNGSSNVAIGAFAGGNVTSGSNNIYIGNVGPSGAESNTIRIGTVATQTVAYMAGISGVTSASGVAVLVNPSGQLGTTTSSRRFKDAIADMGKESDILMKLRPVAFYYKPEYDNTRTRQYGLVAEEVAQVAPELVLSDKDGAPQTVRYHFVNAMLLNEVQKQRRLAEEQWKENEEQRNTIARQHVEIQDLAARLAKVEAALAGGR
jgi:hypothetical protein